MNNIPITYDFDDYQITFSNNKIYWTVGNKKIYFPLKISCHIKHLSELDVPWRIIIIIYSIHGGKITLKMYAKRDVYEMSQFLFQMVYAKPLI